MLTVIVHAKIKEQRLSEYLEMAERVAEEARHRRSGCIAYSFNQNINAPTEFVIYEQWENQESMDNHIKELYKIYGEPEPGLPMPKRLLEMYESAKPAYYKVIGSSA